MVLNERIVRLPMRILLMLVLCVQFGIVDLPSIRSSKSVVSLFELEECGGRAAVVRVDQLRLLVVGALDVELTGCRIDSEDLVEVLRAAKRWNYIFSISFSHLPAVWAHLVGLIVIVLIIRILQQATLSAIDRMDFHQVMQAQIVYAFCLESSWGKYSFRIYFRFQSEQFELLAIHFHIYRQHCKNQCANIYDHCLFIAFSDMDKSFL